MAKTPRKTKSVKEPSYKVNTGEGDDFTAVISGLENLGNIADTTGLSKGLFDFIGKTNADIRQQTYADWAKNKIASKIASEKAKIDMANARANHNRSGGTVQYLGGTGVFTHPHSVGQPVRQYSSANEYLGKTIGKKHAELLAAKNAPYTPLEFGRWEGESKRGRRDYSVGGPNSVGMFDARYGAGGSHLNPTGTGLLKDATPVSRGSNVLNERRSNRREGPQHWIGQTGPTLINWGDTVDHYATGLKRATRDKVRSTYSDPADQNKQRRPVERITKINDALMAKMELEGKSTPILGRYAEGPHLMAQNASRLAVDRPWFGREGAGPSGVISNMMQQLKAGMKEFTQSFTEKVVKPWRSPPPTGSFGDGIVKATKGGGGTGHGGGAIGAGGRADKAGGFLGQVGQQFRHAAIWQTYTPFIAAAGVAAAHYTGISDPADRAAHRLVGVNYNRGQREQIYRQALEAEASRAYTKGTDVITASKEVASNLAIGKSPKDLEKVGELAIIGGHYAIQAEQEQKQAIRTLSRIATQLKRNVPSLNNVPIEDLFVNTASGLGTIQETSSVTGPEMTGFTQRASASLAKLGWQPGEIIAYGAHMIEGGIPYGELGVFSKKMGVGALSEKIAYTNLTYEETKRRAAAGKGAVSAAIPTYREMNKIFSKDKGLALQRESERVNAEFWSGDPKRAFETLTKYSNRFHELSAVGGFPASHLAERQSYNFLQNLYDMPEEAKEAMYSKLDKGRDAWNDVQGYKKKVDEAGEVGTPGEQWARLGGTAYKQLSFMGRNAQTVGRNAYANQLTGLVNSAGNASQLYYLQRNKDTAGINKLRETAEKEYKQGVGEKIDNNAMKANAVADQLLTSKGEYVGGNLPVIGGLVNIAGDALWHTIRYVNKKLSDDVDASRGGYLEKFTENARQWWHGGAYPADAPAGFRYNKEKGKMIGEPSFWGNRSHDSITMVPSSVVGGGGGPLGTNIRPDTPGYKDMNDPANWASTTEDPAWRQQLKDKQSIDVNAMNAQQVNISQPSLDYLITGLQNAGGGAGGQAQRVIIEFKNAPPGTTATTVNPAPTSPNAQPAGQAPPQSAPRGSSSYPGDQG